MVSPSDRDLKVFRIASGEYPVFDGGGAARRGSRWCTPGRNIIHTASAYALALLENLVHWNATALPRGMRYVVATIPATVARTALDPATLPGWDRDDYRISQHYGDTWYDAGEVAVLVVPSVLSPYEPNVLINQRHPDSRRIRVTDEQQAGLDSRLSRSGDPSSAVELHPAFMEAEAKRDMAARDLAQTVIRAPVDGFVSRMRLQRGEWLEAGDPAFTIIDPQATWIEANLKETRLTHVEVGQRVEIEVDAYPGQRWQGEVASISPATGAEFALIPPQNASGNWVKVVQRLPVQIAVEAPDGRPPLRAGMTAAVSIDTEREPRLAEFMRKAVASVSGGP